MQTVSEVSREVISKVAYHAGAKESSFTENSKLIEDVGMDFLERIEMTMAVEDEFDVEISDEEEGAFETVRDVIECVHRKLK